MKVVSELLHVTSKVVLERRQDFVQKPYSTSDCRESGHRSRSSHKLSSGVSKTLQSERQDCVVKVAWLYIFYLHLCRLHRPQIPLLNTPPPQQPLDRRDQRRDELDLQVVRRGDADGAVLDLHLQGDGDVAGVLGQQVAQLEHLGGGEPGVELEVDPGERTAG